MSNALPYICVALAAFVVTYLATPLAKSIAERLGAIDLPSARRINTHPVPRMGGIAIFLGLAIALTVQYIGTKVFGWAAVLIPHPSMTINYPLLGLSACIIFFTGAIDDVFQLSPKAKLFGQILAAVVAVCAGLGISQIIDPFDSGTKIQLGFWGYPLTILYLVAFANIINLIDGLDGLATGISAIAAFSMLNFALTFGRADAAALALPLAASCLAFLRFNFNPASIFLGDSGSLLLGFLLGVISLLNVSRTTALTSMLVPLIVAGVPIIDTFSAIVRRTRAHVSMDVADKGHIHHRLIREGYDQRQAVLIIYGWCILLAVAAAIITQVPVATRLIIFLALAAASFGIAMHLRLFEPVLRHRYNPQTHEDEIIPLEPDAPENGEAVPAEPSHANTPDAATEKPAGFSAGASGADTIPAHDPNPDPTNNPANDHEE